MKKESVSSAMIFLLVSMLASSLTSVEAAPEPAVAVASMTVANPDECVSVNITVADVTDLFSYQAVLAFDGAILDAIGATEGPFLSEGTSSPSGTYFTYQIRDEVQGSYVVIVCVTLGHYPGVTGSGVLFSVDFLVRDGGTSELHLDDTMLVDSSGTEISHSTSDGIFHTTVPRAEFSFTTEYPTTGEDVTFDASASYDPDGTIVSYAWDFGDGKTGTGMVTTHSYAEEDDYMVTLQVTDNEGLSDDASASIHARAPLLAYIAVPYHRQITGYHCGPAALEMVFDFHGADISQREIGDAARTAPDGTYTCEMVRAAHFSDLSAFPIGGHPEDEKGYTARQLGYAALECWDMTIDQLTSLIATGYPIIVLTTWHYRVAVGYSSTRITFQDSFYGENLTMTYDAFDVNWDYSNHWALLVSPWEVEVQTPSAVSLGDAFTIIATITYPSPPSFPSNQYPASLPNATVTLPDGLSLGPGETAKKALGTDELTAGESINVTWTVRAESPGSHTISIEAEGKVTGFVPPLPSYPESYAYEDRVGGVSEALVEVITPASPVEDLQILIETIEGWNLPRGTRNCLTKRLERAVWLLEMDNKDGAIRLLMVFVRTAETFQGRRLTDDQVNYLTAEAQRIIHLIEG